VGSGARPSDRAPIRSLYRQWRDNLIQHGAPGAAMPAPGFPLEQPDIDSGEDDK